MKKFTFYNTDMFMQSMRFYAERWDWQKPMAVSIDELRRKEEQSRKFHAMVRDISLQIPWAGGMRSAAAWKLLLISGHTVATKNEVEMVTGLENELLNIRESSSQMTIRRMASLIEYTQAWGAGNGVKFKETDDYSDFPESRNV